jgi:hypothetical protein
MLCYANLESSEEKPLNSEVNNFGIAFLKKIKIGFSWWAVVVAIHRYHVV